MQAYYLLEPYFQSLVLLTCIHIAIDKDKHLSQQRIKGKPHYTSKASHGGAYNAWKPSFVAIKLN